MTEKNTTQERLRAVKPFEPDWPGPFCTRSGWPVYLITRTARGEYPVLGYIGDAEHITFWAAGGESLLEAGERPKDLMCAEAAVDLPERWVVYCRKEGSQVLLWSSHTDRESAERALDAARDTSNRDGGVSFHLYHATPVILPGEDA